MILVPRAGTLTSSGSFLACAQLTYENGHLHNLHMKMAIFRRGQLTYENGHFVTAELAAAAVS